MSLVWWLQGLGMRAKMGKGEKNYLLLKGRKLKGKNILCRVLESRIRNTIHRLFIWPLKAVSEIETITSFPNSVYLEEKRMNRSECFRREFAYFYIFETKRIYCCANTKTLEIMQIFNLCFFTLGLCFFSLRYFADSQSFYWYADCVSVVKSILLDTNDCVFECRAKHYYKDIERKPLVLPFFIACHHEFLSEERIESSSLTIVSKNSTNHRKQERMRSTDHYDCTFNGSVWSLQRDEQTIQKQQFKLIIAEKNNF